MTDRSKMSRGPYMDSEKYERMKKLASSKGITVQDAFEELIDSTVSSTGNITANTVKVRFGSSSKSISGGNATIEYSNSKTKKGIGRVGQDHIKEFSKQANGELVSPVEHTTGDVEIFVTKYRAAIDLVSRGYTVKTDLEIGDDNIDIFAYDRNGAITDHSLAIQVGELELDDIGEIMNETDELVRIPKGGQISDGISVKQSDFPHREAAIEVNADKFDYKTPSTIADMGHVIYINSEGEQFVPRLDLIMVESLRDVAEHIVTNYNSYDQIDPEKVSKDVNRDKTTKRDIISVLEHLGFKA